MSLVLENLRDGYVEVCRHVLARGHEASPRGRRTRELLGESFVLLDPLDALPTGVGRRVSPRFAAVEALQLIGQTTRPELTTSVNPNTEQFLEPEGRYFYGAYGPRVRWVHALDALRRDPDTRQAVSVIWRLEDATAITRDLPCTVSLQWLLRGDRLHAVTHMRSNDAWWGLAYDAFQFTQLQVTMARLLGVEPGPYHHHVASLHAYERDWAAIEELAGSGSRLTGYPEGFWVSPWNEYDVLRKANDALDGWTAAGLEVEWWHERIFRGA